MRGAGTGPIGEGEIGTGHGVGIGYPPSLLSRPCVQRGLSNTFRDRKSEYRRNCVPFHLPIVEMDLLICERVSHVRTDSGKIPSCFSLESILKNLDHRFRTQLSMSGRVNVITDRECETGSHSGIALELVKSKPIATHCLINTKNRTGDYTITGSVARSRLFRLVLPDSNGANSRTNAVRSLTASLVSLVSTVTGERSAGMINQTLDPDSAFLRSNTQCCFCCHIHC